MTALVVAACGAAGVHLLYTALVLGRRGFGPVRDQDAPRRVSSRVAARRWLTQAGLPSTRPGEFAVVMATLGLIGGLGGYTLFGALLPAAVIGGFAASFPLVSYRNQRQVRRERAHHGWPRLIEEIRVLTSAAGHSVPQALFEAGRRAPEELNGAFDSAHREWLLSTDFERTIGVLKAELADPTADATCETLLVAHLVGGTDLDARLRALAADRTTDVQTRKDAEAHQAGARFARRFVLVVPLGMALAGLSVGTGRAAYQSPSGQILVLVGLALTAACWVWAGRLMRLPSERRVFDR